MEDKSHASERESGDNPGTMSNASQLRRSNNRVIAGVCGGLAEHFGWDPVLVRIAYLLLSILSAAFPGLVVYLVLWLVMPAPDAG